MTNTLTLRSLDIPSIHRFGIGFDSILDELMRMNASQSNNNYPPYNIVQDSEDNFSIEVAVAGFTEGEIELTLENSVLTIAGNKAHDLDSKPKEYLHRGISYRNFEREFILGEHVIIKSAENNNGILTITCERIVPEDKKPKSIAIKYTK
jgi:molecular chaperone IbpA